MENRSKSFLINFAISVFASIVASVIVALITGDMTFSVLFSENFINYFLDQRYLTLVIIFILTIFTGLILSRHLRKKGERGIPVRPLIFIKKYLSVVSTIFELHEFQHIFSRAYNEVRMQGVSSKNFKGIGFYALVGLLEKIQSILKVSTGVDVSINIKAFIKTSEEDKGKKIPLKETYLRVLVRVPSRKESQSLKERDDEMKYYIGSGRERFKRIKNNTPQTMNNWVTNIVKPLKEKVKDKNGEFLVNSSYLYILGNQHHYFISNDLEKEAKLGLYIGNCHNWGEYYKSKAIFLICPNLKENKKVDTKLPIGILVIDSHKKFSFESKFTRKLIGYFAHRLYYILKYYEDTITNERYYEKNN